MAKGFKHGAGGGGAALNFKVVGNPQPEAPSENTIWVNTDVPIPKWYFTVTQPENLGEGDVWFTTGDYSPAAFNVLKKQNIMVYPMSAAQYVDGALVALDAKIYQNGEWVSWTTYIIKDGVINSEYGFVSVQSGYTYPAKLTQSDGYVYLETSRDGFTSMGASVQPVNLTGKTKVVAVIDIVQIGSTADDYCPALVIGTNADISSSTTIASALAKNTGPHTLEVDVSSLNGEYWAGIRVGAYGGNAYSRIKVYDIYT